MNELITKIDQSIDKLENIKLMMISIGENDNEYEISRLYDNCNFLYNDIFNIESELSDHYVYDDNVYDKLKEKMIIKKMFPIYWKLKDLSIEELEKITI